MVGQLTVFALPRASIVFILAKHFQIRNKTRCEEIFRDSRENRSLLAHWTTQRLLENFISFFLYLVRLSAVFECAVENALLAEGVTTILESVGVSEHTGADWTD